MVMRVIGFALAASALVAASAPAQVTTIDPNRAIDGDLSTQGRTTSSTPRTAPRPTPTPAPSVERDWVAQPETTAGASGAGFTQAPAPAYAGQTTEAQQQAQADATLKAASTYQREDLLAAGEGVFGKGAAGLAGMLEKVLKEQGEPNAYIAGREAAGAFVLGVRYGSGIMSHKVEGQQPVYWTGPSVGFDVGGDANKVFVLVYNLYDTEELFRRFPAVEGRLYLVGGFAATYLRRGNIVLIPIRLGVGYRAGVNVGYMKITHKAKWLPF
ncbi:DUF1134 domain-containing protein [uncultured Sphingomonas sp.]|uniref:DUF1134 domain-containing protein n=1 Tax=uncultured Sphingomonas sp. TaxID=158754 RepID=UPI0025D42D93|nr:DUF1134 domain-containing protein [uncultured Sphingomonas sp.]